MNGPVPIDSLVKSWSSSLGVSLTTFEGRIGTDPMSARNGAWGWLSENSTV